VIGEQMGKKREMRKENNEDDLKNSKKYELEIGCLG